MTEKFQAATVAYLCKRTENNVSTSCDGVCSSECWGFQRMTFNIQQVLVKSGDRNGAIISSRLGLTGPRKTIKEVAKEFSLTTSRIRQIEDQAYKQLNHLIIRGRSERRKLIISE